MLSSDHSCFKCYSIIFAFDNILRISEIIFSSYDEAESFIKKHEDETGARYMKRKSRKEHEIGLFSKLFNKEMIGCCYRLTYFDNVKHVFEMLCCVKLTA